MIHLESREKVDRYVRWVNMVNVINCKDFFFLKNDEHTLFVPQVCARVLNFPRFFHPNVQKLGSLGAIESEIWIGNFNVKAQKTTKHKLHKIWRSLKFCKKSAK